MHERDGIALGVLTQRLGPTSQLMGYLSKCLNPTVRGWPSWLRILGTLTLLIEEAFKFTLVGVPIQVFTNPSGKGPLLAIGQPNLKVPGSTFGKS